MNFNGHIKSFFEENDYGRLAQDISLVSKNGILIYSNNASPNNASVGALISGVWQASQSLSEMVSGEESKDLFRFSYDSASSGVYILPLELVQETYFLACVYRDELNPGKLKNTMRLMVSNLEIYMSTFKEEWRRSRSGYLFKDLTDAEVDRMFRASGL